MKSIKHDLDKITDRVIKMKSITPSLIFRDLSGNTLHVRFIRTRGNVQYIAKNAKGRLLDEYGTALVLKEAGYYTRKKGIDIKATSDKGIRLMKLAGINK